MKSSETFFLKIYRLIGADWVNAAKCIASDFLDGYVVVFDVKEEDGEAGEKLFNFVSGIAFARDGEVKRIGDYLYVAIHRDVLGEV